MLRLFGRLSWRRFFLYGSAASLFLFFAFTLAPIISPLPAYTGPHDVGVLDLETEVKRRVIWDARLKDGGRDAFELSTIAVTLYYPSSPLPPNVPQPLARPWLPQPISLIGTGYARMLGIYWPPFQALLTGALWLFGSSTVIPGVVDAPLIPQSEAVLADEDAVIDDLKKIMSAAGSEMADGAGERIEIRSRSGVGKMPCFVFTHGMAGMSQSYSHYLGSIASHGVVVAAVEHRDGSGPGTIVHYLNGTEKEVWHVQLQDFEDDPPLTLSDLKTAQLNFREAEIQETIRLFGRLNAGAGSDIINLKPHSPEESLPSFENRLDLDAVTVAGHSYGATGILQALKSAHSEDTPINGGIALDPGKASGPLNEDIDVPLLVMQSGEWTEKQVDFYGQGSHFDVVKKLVQNVTNGWFMTLTGTAHPSCTDAPLIVPWIMKMILGTTLDPRVALGEYIDVSVEFLDFLRTGKKKGMLKSEVTSAMGPVGDAEKRGIVKGKEGADWEVHVVPGN